MQTPDPRGISRPWNSVVDAAKTFGRPVKARHWSFDPDSGLPCDPATVMSDAQAAVKDAQQERRLGDWSPKRETGGFHIVKNERAGQQGCNVTQVVKYMQPVMKVDGKFVPWDGKDESKRIFPKLVTKTLHVFTYGKVVKFEKSNRAETVLDKRTERRVTQAYVFAELCRMLGSGAGIEAFRELCAP